MCPGLLSPQLLTAIEMNSRSHRNNDLASATQTGEKPWPVGDFLSLCPYSWYESRENSCQLFLSPELEVPVMCVGKFEGQSSKENVQENQDVASWDCCQGI